MLIFGLVFVRLVYYSFISVALSGAWLVTPDSALPLPIILSFVTLHILPSWLLANQCFIKPTESDKSLQCTRQLFHEKKPQQVVATE